MTRVGLFVPQGVFSELATYDPGDVAAHVRGFARRAEQLGFDSLWVSDHFVHIRAADRGGILEGWTLATAVSQVTSRLRIGTLVLGTPFRNPGLVGHMAATLDVLSGGRLVLGLGAGWHVPDFEAYGYRFAAPAARLAHLEQAVVTVREVWAGHADPGRGTGGLGAPTSRPSPLQPRIPIVIGGAGRATLRIVAWHADMSNVTGPPARFRAASEALDRCCQAAGRDPGEIERSWMTMGVVVAETDGAVRRITDGWRDAGDVRYERLEHAGTPEQIVSRLLPYVDAGCSTMMISLLSGDGSDSVELFAAEVLPLLTPAPRSRSRPSAHTE